jgi:uncharacterized protein (TIGR03032 family)
MKRPPGARFDEHERAWRDPLAVIAQWSDLGAADPELLAVRARGGWWDALAAAKVTLIASREYEHLLLAIAPEGRRISYLRLPHPSGIAYDAPRARLYVASTRNPNRLVEFARASAGAQRHVLVPARSWYLPGRSYLHDLALIGGRLHANAVGRNAVVELDARGATPVWWPRSVEHDGAPIEDGNRIQLNSIAAGDELASSYFTASGAEPGRYRPGHLKYPVDRRGVVFSGASREPVVHGLTRPHSARLHGGRLWLDDSGYGRVGVASAGRFDAVAQLPGWTRGLAFAGNVAFVGTSRVIPRFACYAPGLDVDRSICAIHALDATTGTPLGSLEFPHGNQLFALEPVPREWTAGFPFRRGSRAADVRALFYGYELDDQLPR